MDFSNACRTAILVGHRQAGECFRARRLRLHTLQRVGGALQTDLVFGSTVFKGSAGGICVTRKSGDVVIFSSLFKGRVELGFRVPWDAPAKRRPHAGGRAACKAGGIYGSRKSVEVMYDSSLCKGRAGGICGSQNSVYVDLRDDRNSPSIPSSTGSGQALFQRGKQSNFQFPQQPKSHPRAST